MSAAPKSADTDHLLSVEDVAGWLRVSNRWVYERAQRGELASVRVGKYVRFRRHDVAAFVERNVADTRA